MRVIAIVLLSLFLTACTTPSQWCVGSCQQTNPIQKGIRETSRSFSGIGLKDDAVSILCTSKYAKETPTCKAQTTSNTSIQE